MIVNHRLNFDHFSDQIALYKQFLTRVYFCGVEPDLRTQVWPYLLRLVNWHEDLDIERLGQIENEYKADLEEWVELESKFTTNGGDHVQGEDT